MVSFGRGARQLHLQIRHAIAALHNQVYGIAALFRETHTKSLDQLAGLIHAGCLHAYFQGIGHFRAGRAVERDGAAGGDVKAGSGGHGFRTRANFNPVLAFARESRFPGAGDAQKTENAENNQYGGPEHDHRFRRA